MTRANLTARGTLLIESGTYHRPDLRHLHIICTNPDADDRQLVVSINSIRPGEFYDEGCVLVANEHKFIKHPSFVNYELASIAYRSRLLEKLANGKAAPYPPDLNNQVFPRVLNGIDRSSCIQPNVQTYYHSRKHLTIQANRHSLACTD